MATTTTNFGWDIPQSTDLVKDGATAIAALGQDIDTAFIDLKGGTTGQVLAKASATDLDFSWVAQDDSNAIQNAIVDAKGDLIAATANDTPARLGVGTNGQVLTADSTAATGLTWASPSSGGMTLISTTTLSGASVTLNSFSGYKNLQLIVRNYKPASDATECRMQVNADSTANRHATFATVSGTAGNTFNAVSWLVAETQDNSVATGFWVIDIPDYANTDTMKSARGYAISNNATNTANFNTQNSVFYYNQTSAITSLVLFPSTGNFTSGTALLYGVK